MMMMMINRYYLTAIIYFNYLLDTLTSTPTNIFTAATIVINNQDTTIVRNIPSGQRQALHDLYDATEGYDWKYPYGDHGHWNFTDDNVNPCSTTDPWQGLSCTSSSSALLSSSLSPSPESSSTLEYDYITTIELPHYHLKGSIPNSINQIKTLILLNLSSNSITNTIPNTIGTTTESSSSHVMLLLNQFHYQPQSYSYSSCYDDHHHYNLSYYSHLHFILDQYRYTDRINRTRSLRE